MVKNPYKCTLIEIELRLIKLNKAMEVIKSNESEYIKAEQLLGLYKNSEELRRMYFLFIKHGENDFRLDSAREALENFDNILILLNY